MPPHTSRTSGDFNLPPAFPSHTHVAYVSKCQMSRPLYKGDSARETGLEYLLQAAIVGVFTSSRD
ncbi:hypothetical protein E2C01_084057 [Portunus trituberculatus]|uniref:Uncharacterized protein n=1 Tax=Portunus trituberculatus TaxID=210409 RepID=A0A5B7J9N5_PORTR|nr:hypothetical protein [Portunus trituberculatus]